MHLPARLTRILSLLALLALGLVSQTGCGVGGMIDDIGGTVGGNGGGGGSGGGSSGGPYTAEQQHNLDAVNAYRAMVGAPPLVLDDALTAYALAGSQQLMADHTPHAHFRATSCPYQAGCAENQGDPNGWHAMSSVNAQIDDILLAMWNEGPGTGSAHGHYNNMVNPAYTKLGVGLVVDGAGELYFTNDFQ